MSVPGWPAKSAKLEGDALTAFVNSVNIVKHGIRQDNKQLYLLLAVGPFSDEKDDKICNHMCSFTRQATPKTILSAFKRLVHVSGRQYIALHEIPPDVSKNFATRILMQRADIVAMYPGISRQHKDAVRSNKEKAMIAELRGVMRKARGFMSSEDIIRIAEECLVEEVLTK